MARPVVLVTGASRGIGAATAVRLGEEGATTVLVGRSADRLEVTAQRVRGAGGSASVELADLHEPGVAAALVHRVVAAHGRLDALVNNAADIQPLARIGQAMEDDWRRAVTLNLLAPVGLIQAALPSLRRSRGRVINVGSTAAHRAIIGLGAYCVTKAGLFSLTRVLALEEPEVTVLSFSPGRTDTAIHATIRSEAAGAMTEDQVANYHRLQAEGELADPDLPGRTLAWLVLHAPHGWSGTELERGDARLPDPLRT